MGETLVRFMDCDGRSGPQDGESKGVCRFASNAFRRQPSKEEGNANEDLDADEETNQIDCGGTGQQPQVPKRPPAQPPLLQTTQALPSKPPIIETSQTPENPISMLPIQTQAPLDSCLKILLFHQKELSKIEIEAEEGAEEIRERRSRSNEANKYWGTIASESL